MEEQAADLKADEHRDACENGQPDEGRCSRDAKAAAGAKTDTDTVRLGLEALVRRAAYERLRALRGSEPHAAETPRRRERPVSAKNSAA